MNFYKGEILPDGIEKTGDVIKFKGENSFVNCYSPLRMIELGIFGWGYFGIPDVSKIELEKILNEVPLFKEQLNEELQSKIYRSPQDFSLNCYGIKAGLDYTYWLDNKWIHDDDPYGWFNWYIRFYYGRRHPDDSRQIKRFRSFIKRHWGMLRIHCYKANKNLETGSEYYPKTCQGLLQWGWDYRIDPNKNF